MDEKTKKWLLSLALRCGVCLFLVVVMYMIKAFSPEIFAPVKSYVTKSVDIEKIGTLFRQIVKEVLM